MGLLQGEDVAIDAVGDTDAAATGHGAGIFLDEEAPPGAACLAFAERSVLAEAREHLLHHGMEEDALEILCGFAGFGLGRSGSGVAAGFLGLQDASGPRGVDWCGVGHHSTSISAWSAPAALIACRIEIMSRGP